MDDPEFTSLPPLPERAATAWFHRGLPNFDDYSLPSTGSHDLYTVDQMREYARTAQGSKPWPVGLLDRVKAAAKRIENNECPRRIPADPTDVDLVLAEVQAYLEGREPPFWLAKAQ